MTYKLHIIKCQRCGKFIKHVDIESGKATMRMITPDSEVSYETFETLCAKCTQKEKESEGST